MAACHAEARVKPHASERRREGFPEESYTYDMRVRFAIVLLLLSLPAAAWAQADGGASVGGSVSATSMDSSTALSFAGSFDYRFNSVVGLELEVTWVPELESPFPEDRVTIQSSSSVGSSAGSFIQIFPTPSFRNPEGRAVIFANSVRVNIPTTTRRLEPYFVAGGGLASVRRTADFVYTSFFGVTPVPSVPGIPIPLPQPRTFTEHVTSSSVDLALTLGGGLGVRVASQLSIDADLRVFRLLGDEDRNVGRFGVGVRYRF